MRLFGGPGFGGETNRAFGVSTNSQQACEISGSSITKHSRDLPSIPGGKCKKNGCQLMVWVGGFGLVVVWIPRILL